MPCYLIVNCEVKTQSLLSMCLARGGPSATELLRNDLKFSESEILKLTTRCTVCGKHISGLIIKPEDATIVLAKKRDLWIDYSFPCDFMACSTDCLTKHMSIQNSYIHIFN